MGKKIQCPSPQVVQLFKGGKGALCGKGGCGPQETRGTRQLVTRVVSARKIGRMGQESVPNVYIATNNVLKMVNSFISDSHHFNEVDP